MCAAALTNAVLQSFNAPRSDDITFLEWALVRVDDPNTPFFRPPPFPGWRPANASVWWVSAVVDGARGLAPQVSVALFWLVAWGALTRWADTRWGRGAGLWTGALLLVSAPFRDLVCWRSWNTTAGELAGIGVALLALESGVTWVAIAAGSLATWFKEPAILVVPTAALFVYRKPWVALSVAVAGGAGFVRAIADDLPAGNSLVGILDGIRFYGWTMLRLVWPAVAAVLAVGWYVRRSKAENAAASARDRPMIAVLASALALAVLYPTRNEAYAAEAIAVGAGLAGAVFAGLGRPWVLLLTLLASAWSLPSSLGNARWQAARLTRLQLAFAELRVRPVGAWKLAEDADDDDRWLALRLRYDLGVPEALGDWPATGKLVVLDSEAK